ncbi:MAG: alkaline phosphatase family protein, partial [Myxococcota bacterium]|nr:alkaline phosphatase family protein [Myxococcota bacterium]
MLRRLGVIPVLFGLLTACSSSPLGSPPPEEPKAKVVVLGFDGVDPDRVEALWAQGRLPNLKKLAEEGAWARLRSTQPPQSPVAWATFATGMLPGKHGIFDFIARNPATYRPRMGALEYKPPGFSPGGTPLGEI